ncbi:MAG: hypothetical protein JST37_12160 [Bacteroidetes bacterium]|nr:hypothetical protein [Bacteroidota bacterium]
MDSKRIEQLLEKYWDAQTSLEEEEELHQYFKNNPVPEVWKETAELFRYFDHEKNKMITDINFDQAVTKQLSQRQEKKVIEMKSWLQIARVAAGVLVVVAAVYLIGLEVRNSSTKEIADTETDPQLAFEETKKALLMISRSFNKAQQEASKINLLNEAEQKIKSKTSETEKDKKENI